MALKVSPFDPILCAHCDAAEATEWLDPADPEDPCCPACYALYWVECSNCGAIVSPEDTGERLVCRQTHESPAEYDACCIRCAPSDDREPDYDAINDERWADGY